MFSRILAGTTNKIIEFPIYDSSSSVGALLSNLTYNSSGLVAFYDIWGSAGSSNSISLNTMTKGTYTPSGFIAVDGTNMPGVYQLGIPNIVLAPGAQGATIQLKGASNMVPVTIGLELTSVTDYPANITQISGSNVSTSTAQLGVNVVNINGVSQTGRDIGSSVVVGTNNDKIGYSLSSNQTFNNTGNIIGNLSGSVTNVLSGVVVTTNNDKINYNLATPPPTAIQVRQEMDSHSTQLSGIVSSVNSLHNTSTTDIFNQTTLALNTTIPVNPNLDSIFYYFNNITELPNLTNAMLTQSELALTNYDPPTNAELTSAVYPLATSGMVSAVASNVSSIKLKTDNLPSGITKNIALNNFTFLMRNSIDHVSGKTGLTVNGQIKKDAGSFNNLTNTPVEVAYGLYVVNLTSTEMNADILTLRFSATGADDTIMEIKTVS